MPRFKVRKKEEKQFSWLKLAIKAGAAAAVVAIFIGVARNSATPNPQADDDEPMLFT